MKLHKHLILFLTMLLAGFAAQSQIVPKNRKSPMAQAFIKTDHTYFKVVYSQPFKNERTIFGTLVPYGEVWRTGANEATEITLTNKVKFGNKILPAGTYSLFSIPNEKVWTIIVNKDLGLWGAFDYKKDNDVLRIEIPVTQVDTTWEAFTIKFDKKPKGANMQLIWDKTMAVVPIEFIKP